jgi:ABC-type uncharacterized transport system permease subunit
MQLLCEQCCRLEEQLIRGCDNSKRLPATTRQLFASEVGSEGGLSGKVRLNSRSFYERTLKGFFRTPAASSVGQSPPELTRVGGNVLSYTRSAMRQILEASFILSAASYLAACLLFLVQARRRSAFPLGLLWAPRVLEIGAVLQFIYLVLFAVMDRHCPVYSLHSALGIVSLVGVASYAVLSRGRHLEALGGFVAASAAVFLVVARSLAASTPVPDQRWLMAIHITSNLLGGGILLVAGCASAFYVVNERRLKSRRALGQGSKLPPLESLDAVVHRLLWIGLPLLTIGLLTGRMVIKHADVVTAGEKFRAALSGASWLLLMAVLILRQAASWRGRRPAYATLGGALGILIVIALYVARAVLGDGL